MTDVTMSELVEAAAGLPTISALSATPFNSNAADVPALVTDLAAYLSPMVAKINELQDGYTKIKAHIQATTTAWEEEA